VAPLPPDCRLLPLDATLDRRAGADGKTYGIGFALALPSDWNGRFLFQGGGGLNVPRWPRRSDGPGRQTPRWRVGTQSSPRCRPRGQAFDASFMADQQASLDFAYQAVGRVAVLAEQIIALYYDRPAAHSYFMAARRAAVAC